MSANLLMSGLHFHYLGTAGGGAGHLAEPWGRYHLGRTGLAYDDIASANLAQVVKYTLPHSIMGTPAISLPMAMHGSGLPIGVQLVAPPAHENLPLQMATQFEASQPWAGRVPPLHVSG